MDAGTKAVRDWGLIIGMIGQKFLWYIVHTEPMQQPMQLLLSAPSGAQTVDWKAFNGLGTQRGNNFALHHCTQLPNMQSMTGLFGTPVTSTVQGSSHQCTMMQSALHNAAVSWPSTVHDYTDAVWVWRPPQQGVKDGRCTCVGADLADDGTSGAYKPTHSISGNSQGT